MSADVQRELAEVTLTHRQRSSSPDGIECACGWVGPWFSRHQAEALAPAVQRLIADAEERAAAAAVEPVRALHRRVDRGSGPECMECVKHLTLSTGWPCATIAALDPAGAASGETT